MAPPTNTNIGDHLVLNIEKLIKDDEVLDTAVCVYHVPKSLSSAKPEAYTPQFVGLGPYHHFRPEVYRKRKLKEAAVKGVLKDLFHFHGTDERSKLVKELKELNLAAKIQDSYYSSVEFQDDALLNLMTVDALFIYALLRSLEIDEESDGIVTKFHLNDSILTGIQGIPLINAAGVELTKDAIIRDAFMLENQIPTDIIKQIMKKVITSKKTELHIDVDEHVRSKMLDFCRAVCPVLKIEQVNKSEAVKRVHLLDLMYHLIVHEPETKPESESQHEHQPESEPQTGVKPEDEKAQQDDQKSPHKKDVKPTRTCCFFSYVYWTCFFIFFLMIAILSIIFWVVVFIVHVIFGALGKIHGLLKKGAKFVFPELENLHKRLNAIQPLQPLAILVGGIKDACKLLMKESPNSEMGARPAVTIPSVTELHNAGIHFKPANGGISSIKFEEEKSTFYLPRIRVDVNAEVIIRNLLAYESLTKSDCLIFTWYVELMRTVIKTAEDVKLLVHEKIIQTELSDHEQIVQLFNGISKSIRPTKIPVLEKEIKKIITKYNSTDGQKLNRFMTNYVYPSGSFLTVVGALALLVLTAMQTYCSIHGCSGTSKFGKLPEEGVEYRNNYFVSSM